MMTEGAIDEQPAGSVKRDASGRVRTSAAERAAWLERFDRSGLSRRAFARANGINYQTFAGWCQDRGRLAAVKASDKATAEGIRLLEAVVVTDGTPVVAEARCAALSVFLPCGSRVEIAGEDQVVLAARLIKALVYHGGASTRC